MYPPLMMLYPDIARSCLLYRFNRLDAAKKNAQKHNFEGSANTHTKQIIFSMPFLLN